MLISGVYLRDGADAADGNGLCSLPGTAKCRDYWLFLYLCNGINMANFVKLKYSNIENGEIFFVRQKTERTIRTRKEIRAVITDEMHAIIDCWRNQPRPDSYIFPVLNGDEDAVTS